MTKTPHAQWRPHPWHGLEVGEDPPRIVCAYIEITPFDLVKYEVDKVTGYLRVDRPQRTSSQPPTLYGFVPRTYCGPRVGKLSPGAQRGDGDPLDICVISERHITKSEILLRARVIGGIQMIDNEEADDKIVAVLVGDYVWGKAGKMDDVPPVLIERLEHYLRTYKMIPGSENNVRIAGVYDTEHAIDVIRAAVEDYDEAFGDFVNR